MDADAYTFGRDIVLGESGQDGSEPGRDRVLAQALAHVVRGGAEDVVHRYRRSGTMAFAERDTSYMEPQIHFGGVVPTISLTRRDLVEDSIDMTKDKETKPWIERVDVDFDGTATDSSGNVFSTGNARATYYGNPVAWRDFTFGVSGGSGRMGTDPGSFTVHRIEGYGHNSGSASGTPGVDFDWSDREPRKKGTHDHRYTKKDPVTGTRSANMSFAVFYNRGEALHAGPLDFTSHGCVHVDWTTVGAGWSAMQQLNYHSVVDWTKVKVRYV